MQRKLPPPAAPPAAPRANKRDLRWISPRALTPAAVQTFRGVISRPKETIRSIRTGSTDIDRTVQTTMWIGATADPTSPVRQELHLQSCEQPDVVRGGRPLIVGWYSFGPEHWPPHRSRRCRCQSPLSIRPSFAWRAEARWAAGSGLRRAAPLLVFYGGRYEATPACPRSTQSLFAMSIAEEVLRPQGEQTRERALRRQGRYGRACGKCVRQVQQAAEHGMLSMACQRGSKALPPPCCLQAWTQHLRDLSRLA